MHPLALGHGRSAFTHMEVISVVDH